MEQVKFPLQPVVIAEDGCIRFAENRIVTYLLDNGGIDLNKIASLAFTSNFSNAEQEQFAQLIGYSVSGFADLSYVSDEAYYAAAFQAEKLVPKLKSNP